jgi:hypothetical protein
VSVSVLPEKCLSCFGKLDKDWLEECLARRVTVSFYGAKGTVYNIWLTGGLHYKT